MERPRAHDPSKARTPGRPGPIVVRIGHAAAIDNDPGLVPNTHRSLASRRQLIRWPPCWRVLRRPCAGEFTASYKLVFTGWASPGRKGHIAHADQGENDDVDT